MKQIFFLVSVATLMSACNGAVPVSSPIAPSPSSPSAPAPPQPTYTLSGVISEVTPSGRVPVEGVLVEEVLCNPLCTNPVQTATTDPNGFYRLSEFPAGQARFLWLSKKGYRADELSVTITTDTRLDLELLRL
jgi:hypothetical protein